MKNKTGIAPFGHRFMTQQETDNNELGDISQILSEMEAQTYRADRGRPVIVAEYEGP